MLEINELNDLKKHAKLIFSMEQVDQALAVFAEQINEDYRHRSPIILTVMNGGLVAAGRLLPMLAFPLELDYIHATRYQGNTTGEHVRWMVQPQLSLVDRDIIILDDILDVGITLSEIMDYCRERGAKTIATAVLLNKQHDRKVFVKPDYVALQCDDSFIFGCGMDIRGFWRNAPGIFALNQ